LTPEQEKDVLTVLGLERDDRLDLPLQNAVPSRVKTLIPIREVARLQALRADMPTIEALFQGHAMGCLSEIRVRLGWVGRRAIGCLLSGTVTPAPRSGLTAS
jgi:hypothetical protein